MVLMDRGGNVPTQVLILVGSRDTFRNHLEDVEVRKNGYISAMFFPPPVRSIVGEKAGPAESGSSCGVCHEKVVRISLEGDEILRVQGERTQGVAKTLLNTKAKVSYDLVIFCREHQCRLLRREVWSLFEVSVGITEEGEAACQVTYLRFIVNFSKIVKPITSLTERNQKYEWGEEREESSVKDKILATSSETSKVENALAEMLRDLDQQMEKRADDD
ncbi:hypothetical protein Tco_0428000 [Tanacetum coccineum]